MQHAVAQADPPVPKTGPGYKRMSGPAPRKELYGRTFLIALAVAAVIFLPAYIMGQGYFFPGGDFTAQQIPFYKMGHQMVREGSFFWNWNTDLGVNFIGSYSFYLLGNPFFWLTIPFPNWMIPHLMAPLLILKFACAAFTAYFYIRRFTRTPDAAMLGGLLYAFSGAALQNGLFGHLLEAAVVFPLLLLAIEQFMADNRRCPVVAAVFLGAMTAGPFFPDMAIFCVVYWFIRMLSDCWELSLRRLGAFAGEVFLGLGLAAILSLPAYLSLSQNGTAGLAGSDWFSGAAWLPAACILPVFGLIGLFLFLLDKKKHWLRRILDLSAFLSLFAILASAFHTFNTADYVRWLYMPTLMVSLAAVTGLEDRRTDWKRPFKWTAGATFILLLILGGFPVMSNGRKSPWGLLRKDDGGSHAIVLQFMLLCAVAAGCLLLLGFLLRLRKRDAKLFTRAAVLAVCIVTVGYGLYYVHASKIPWDMVKNDFIDRLAEGEVQLPEEDGYRIDLYQGQNNAGMYLGYPSIQAFQPIVPPSIRAYYSYVGVERSTASRPGVQAYAVRPFLSVKYLLEVSEQKFAEDGQTKMPGYALLEEQNGYNIYENKNYIPYGFTYDYYMTPLECDAYEYGERAQLMLKAVLLDEEQAERHKDILKSLGQDYNLTNSVLEDPGRVNGLTAAEVMQQIKEGKLTDQRQAIDFSEEAFANDCAARAKTASKSFETDSRGFTAAVELDRENLVFFSVPYEEDGWTATIDGKPADIETVNVGFMAVRVPEGAHTVRFDYMTPGLKYGVLLTLGSIVIFVLYVLIVRSRKKRYPERWLVGYPEGDLLAERFEKDAAGEAHTPSESSWEMLTDLNGPDRRRP